VSRLNWRPTGKRVLVRLPGETRVAAFADFDAADADRTDREAAARAIVNPFCCGVVWCDRSHLPEPVFRDFVRDAGVEPPTIVAPADPDGHPALRKRRQQAEAPESGFVSWAAWWEATAPALSAEQCARVWEGLGRVRFFRTEERPVRSVAYTVVEIRWNYNDMWYYPGDEGGEHVVAYRSRERAEAECARRNAEARERWRRDLDLAPAAEVANPDADPDQLYQFDMQTRPFPDRSPFELQLRPSERAQEDANSDLFTVDEVPFFEVVEIEVEGA
jgi:hypothetical protein